MPGRIETGDVADPLLLAALDAVPRDRFVPARYEREAYGDHPLPIGHGQTISQPYVVAVMSELLEARPGDRVLEVGTGSGYQAAVLAEMGLQVYSVEIIPELADRAARTLEDLGYRVEMKIGDGYSGWEEHAPYDGIVVTAAPAEVPGALLEQLVPGGHLVIPVGPAGGVQKLWRFTAGASGEAGAEDLGAVRFVPLVRGDP